MNVRNITSCPTKLDVFRSRGRNLGCSVGNEYHCMLDEKKHHVELCISRSWIQPDHCPEYNSAANRIDVTSCDASEGVCPPTIYWSNTTFQYSGCVPEHENAENKYESDQEKGNKDVLIAAVISAVIVFLLVILCTFLLCRKKRRRRNKKDTTLLPSEPVSSDQLEKGKKIIQDHRKDGTYVPTYAARKGREIFNKKNILIIQGITGSGKTKTALEIASEWLKEDETSRKCIYRNSIEDPRFIEYNYDSTCIILDDCFTRWALDSSSTFIPECCVQLNKQIRSREDMYLIITIDSFICSSHRHILHPYELFSHQHALTLRYDNLEEKNKILSSHLINARISSEDHHVLMAKELQNLLSVKCTNAVGFPSVCWMYANIPECKEKGKTFFQSCEYILQKVIDTMNNQQLECSLYYVFLRKTSEGIHTKHIDEKCLKEIASEYKYGKITEETLSSNLREEKRYFSKGKDEEDGQNNFVVTFSQTIIYEKCLKKWLSKKRDAFLRLCSVEQVKENIRDETYPEKKDECLLKLKVDEFPMFASKFAALMEDHEDLERHPLLQNQTFMKELAKERGYEIKSKPQNRELKKRNESKKIENNPEFQKDESKKGEYMKWEIRPLMNDESTILQDEENKANHLNRSTPFREKR